MNDDWNQSWSPDHVKPSEERSAPHTHTEPEKNPHQTPGFIRQYGLDFVQLLTEPKHFFEVRFPQLSTTQALAFGLISVWIGAVLDWLTRLVRHETLMDGFRKIQDTLSQLPFWKNLPADIWSQGVNSPSSMPIWMSELIGISLIPFGSLIGFLLKAASLWLGVYLLLPNRDARKNAHQDELSYVLVLKIIAIVAATEILGSILTFLPMNLGKLVAVIYAFALTVIALRTRFVVSGLRATAMIFLPTIISIVALGLFFALLGVILVGGFMALLGTGS